MTQPTTDRIETAYADAMTRRLMRALLETIDGRRPLRNIEAHATPAVLAAVQHGIDNRSDRQAVAQLVTLHLHRRHDSHTSDFHGTYRRGKQGRIRAFAGTVDTDATAATGTLTSFQII